RSSILFAVVAGFSLGILSGRLEPHSGEKMVRTRLRVFVRCALLLVVAAILQMMGTPIGIILGYYAVWFALAIPFLRWRARSLLILAAAWAVIGPLLLQYLPVMLQVVGLGVEGMIEPNGAVTGFMLTGQYPGVVWMAFIFLGMGLSRLDWSDARRAGVLFAVGALCALIGYVGSHFVLRGIDPGAAPPFEFVSPDDSVDAAGTGESPIFELTAEDLVYYEEMYVSGYITLEDLEAFVAPDQLAEITDGKIDGVAVEPWVEGKEPWNLGENGEVIVEESWGEAIEPGRPQWNTNVSWPEPHMTLVSAPHSGGIGEVVGSSGVAMMVIAGGLLIAPRAAWLLAPLAALGSMSLSIYTLHVVSVWFQGTEVVWNKTGNWLLLWNLLALTAFAMAWKFFFSRGPLEHWMHVASQKAIRAK
ncbi:MAG: hypothetical protein Q4G64_10785, partial [bacterium]|nr:hypothetical protein [bacterium]